MDRNTVVDSIYERYMEDDRGHGRESSAPSITTTEHLSLAPPMPRLNLQNNGRNNIHSTADTASVYTTATTPYERWSLEQGLDARQSAFNPALSTQRPPESPSLSALRKIGSKDQLPRLNVTDLEPNGPYSPSVGASPVPSQQPRRHFSRPFRPAESTSPIEEEETRVPPFAPPTITVAHHRFSNSSPDAYGGASFGTPIIQRDSVQSARSSTYSNDIAAFPDPTHLRRRSNPVNNLSDNAGEANPRSSMQTVREALAARHIHKNSLGDLSIIESVDEEFSEKPKSSDRPFSPSNTYPFTTGANAMASHGRASSPKPSSRFSDDEKRGFQTLSENNDFQASAWNLFGRSPTPLSPRFGNGGFEKTPGVAVAKHAEARRKRRRRMIWITAAVLVLLALAGAGAGIGVWRKNVADLEAQQNATKLRGMGTGDTSHGEADAGIAADDPTKTSSSDASRSSATPTAVPGSGGAGGYSAMVTFGGSYADNGHTRSPELASTLKNGQYYNGRSSNGLVFTDYLATMIGPQSAGGGSALSFDYAYSGAFINNTITYAPIPDISQQVSQYLQDLDNGNATVTATAANKTLVAVWAGMEQLVTIWQAAMGTNPDNVLDAAIAGVNSMLSTLATSLSWLIPAEPTTRARPDFALVSLPQGNLLPEIQSLSGNNQNLVDIFQNLTDHFNDGLAGVAAALNATTVYTFNAESFLNKVISEASSYNITNTAQSCLATTCATPNQYIWYDGLNPSSTIHRLIARKLAQAILKS